MTTVENDYTNFEMQRQMTYTDTELISKIIDGDKNAFSDLYYRYKDKLYSFAYSLTGSKPESEDLVQEVFSKIWERRHSFDGKNITSSYFFKMTKNFCIDKLRRFTREILTCNPLLENSTCHQADSEILYKEASHILQISVNHLSQRQKEVYLLRRKGIKYAEIAEMLGLSVSTVENHFNSAMENIRKNFREKYNIPAFQLFLILLALLWK